MAVVQPYLEARTDRGDRVLGVTLTFRPGDNEPNLWSPGVRIESITIAGHRTRWTKTGERLRAWLPPAVAREFALGRRYAVALETNDGHAPVGSLEVLRKAPVTICSPASPC